jgi:hypothetical protein
VARIDLSPGHWAELRDATELRAGDKMDLSALLEPNKPAASTIAMLTALVQKLVTNWQVSDPAGNQLPLPQVFPDVVRQLSIADYDALTEAVRPAMDLLFPQAQPKTAEETVKQAADPESPTIPSAV